MPLSTSLHMYPASACVDSDKARRYGKRMKRGQCYWLIVGFALITQLGYGQGAPHLIDAVGIKLTTTGPGLTLSRTLSTTHRLDLVVQGQYIAYRKPIKVDVSSESYLNIAPDVMIGLVQAGVNWHPFRRSSFFLAGGVAYSWHPYIGAVATTDTKLKLDGLELTPEDVGTVDLRLQWQSVLGYVGWGFGRAVPRKRFGVGVEMGVYYLGRPRVNLAYEGFLETTTLDEQVPIVENNLRNYRYLPTLNLRLTYNLNRPTL